MTTRAQLRKAALALPEAAEQRGGSGEIAFTVRDKRFAAVDGEGRVRLELSASDAEAVLAAHPTGQRLTSDSTATGVRISLAEINGQQLNHWVWRAWLARAPKSLAARMSAAEDGSAGVGDLPTAIGKPALRALAAAEITTLAQVAESTETRLLAMHGIGPKAVRILRAALEATGRSFRE
ncbi:hypothetical protein ACRS6B_23990 [Nocardia asteroides]